MKIEISDNHLVTDGPMEVSCVIWVGKDKDGAVYGTGHFIDLGLTEAEMFKAIHAIRGKANTL